MKPDRIKISQDFTGMWLCTEIPIAPEENIIEEFKKGKDLLMEAYKELTEPRFVPISEALGITKLERTRSEIIQSHLQTINECKTIRNLEMFANMVQRENEQVLFDAFNEKKKQLQ
jgi:hypothetical protein